ncbi:MAG: DegT/DnrJ/EryC1/StrS family aminotransferase [Candidatus Omnitrophica bacterium]|nr:DegT/DnrJ/EryC1/StrS family aminotransferase [Candidatus Omnitrophota bacterium]
MNKRLKNPSKYLGNELTYLEKVLQTESWSATSGNWNQTLEKAFAKKFGIKYAVAFNSGTSTLHAALVAAGVQPGDEVISPALTVFMNTSATIHANAIPVYADISRKTFTIDPADVERKITQKTKAIITVSLYGLPPNMDPIMAIAKKNNIIVIEDNAQCFLSTYNGRLTGTIGHMASYSFENTKHISCGEGGIIITDNPVYAESVRKIGGHGFKNLKADEGRVRLKQDIFQNPHYKRHDILGWNYRLSEFNAAIALAQLEKIEALLELRIKSAEIFKQVMANCNYLIPQEVPDNYTHSYYTLGVVYEGEARIGVPWEEFRKEYIKAGGDGVYGAWSVPYLEPVMTQRQFVERCPAIYKTLRYREGLCPVAESVQPKIMQFKTNYRDISLAKKKAAALHRVIKKFSKKKPA